MHSVRYSTIRLILLLAVLVVSIFSPLLLSAEVEQNTEISEEPPDEEPTTDPFTDITPTSPYFIPVSFLKDNELIKGYSDGSFKPERLVSRAEALAMILKIAGIEPNIETNPTKDIDPENPLQITLARATDITIKNLVTGEETVLNKIRNFRIDVEEGIAFFSIIKDATEAPFNDVSEADWFYEIVREGKLRSIVIGYEGGKYFRPNADVNLAEVLRMLFKATETDTDNAQADLPEDFDTNAWYANDIAYAVSHYMLTQRPNKAIFPPHSTLNRGQLALLLYRFVKSKENVSFGYASWYADGLAKTELSSGLEYKEQNLTAAHRELPFGTVVRVTNANNGKQTNVVINDRGPFVIGRIIDLSRSAFAALETPSAGIISVQVEVVTPP